MLHMSDSAMNIMLNHADRLYTRATLQQCYICFTLAEKGAKMT